MTKIERLKKLAAADSTPEEIRKELIDILSTPPQMWPSVPNINPRYPAWNPYEPLSPGTIWRSSNGVSASEIKVNY
jgi:hypothetical protein